MSAAPSARTEVHAGETLADGARRYANTLITDPTQFACLDLLWTHESGWRATADNPTSSAYGIAQRLDETSHDPRVQIARGLAYIAARYGSPCNAWAFWRRQRPNGWY